MHFSTAVKHDMRSSTNKAKRRIAGSSRLTSTDFPTTTNSAGVRHELCLHTMPKIPSGTRSPRRAASASFPNYQQITEPGTG